MTNDGFALDCDREAYVLNCLAICHDIFRKCVKETGETHSQEDQGRIVYGELGAERIELIKDGLYLCNCCRKHKAQCPGIYCRTEMQISYIVRQDKSHCDCECQKYLTWLFYLNKPVDESELTIDDWLVENGYDVNDHIDNTDQDDDLLNSICIFKI